MEAIKRILMFTVIGAVIVGLGWVFWFFQTHKFVEPYELGYRFNALNGEITQLDRTGWIEHRFFVEDVRAIDMRPAQVCIRGESSVNPTINQRVLNCKLVRFAPDGLLLFLSWHGRIEGDVSEYLRIYAYDGAGRSYPFLEIIRELQNVDVAPNAGLPQTIEVAPVEQAQ